MIKIRISWDIFLLKLTNRMTNLILFIGNLINKETKHNQLFIKD